MHHTTEKPFIVEEEMERMRAKLAPHDLEGENRKARRKRAAQQRQWERKMKESA